MAEGHVERLHAQLQQERARYVEMETELEVERTAHNSTAETLVEVQQRLEVTLQVRLAELQRMRVGRAYGRTRRTQELANLERFTKRQQAVAVAEPDVERLLREESYLQSRLAFVQQVPGDALALTMQRVLTARILVSQELDQRRGTSGARGAPVVRLSEDMLST